MYPYGKNEPMPNTLHTTAAESDTVAISERLRTFLEENPDYGFLTFQISSGQGAFPIKGAKVVITKQLDDKHAFSTTLYSDKRQNRGTPLPAPARSLSQTPGGQNVSSLYQVAVTIPGYGQVDLIDIPIFTGVTSIQYINLIPASPGNNQTQTIIGSEPGL